MAAFVVLKIGKRVCKWYRLAAERGQGLAQFKLGVMYANGKGVPEDDKQAVKWYRLAAEQGLARAQFNLGHMYEKGVCVLEDDVIAYMWFNLAGAEGNDIAINNKKILTGRMTRSQIEEAQKLSRECLKKEYKNCY